MGCSNSNVKNKLTSNNIQERYEFVPNLDNNSIKKENIKIRIIILILLKISQKKKYP